MVLDLKDLFAGGEQISFDYEMDLCSYEMPGGKYPFKEPVRVYGEVFSRAGVVTLAGKADCVYHTTCDRCLEPIDEPISVPLANVIVTRVSGEGGDDILICEDRMLDLDALATSNIVLGVPMKHLCRPDCKGICPKCGKNLNLGDCGCKRDGGSAFETLGDLLH